MKSAINLCYFMFSYYVVVMNLYNISSDCSWCYDECVVMSQLQV